jgi:aminopeptidase N
MPVASSAPSTAFPGTLRVAFAATPLMSTYLLALVVAPLVASSATFGSKTITSYGVNRSASRGRLDFATAVAAKIIPYYENLFEAPFPLPKMDMVALPDFAAGA